MMTRAEADNRINRKDIFQNPAENKSTFKHLKEIKRHSIISERSFQGRSLQKEMKECLFSFRPFFFPAFILSGFFLFSLSGSDDPARIFG
ncbi:MAG TPA: hypothetical protein DEP61_05940 [Lachnospiraceae bacterium]|nr:hypothetical protein [Lachnospiraceae bacterium]